MKVLGLFVKGLRSLSARLLLLTVLFVMLAEVLIFVPSVAFFRENYLIKKTEFAHLASLALLASPDQMVSKELREELLFRVGARSVVFRSANSSMLMLTEDMPSKVDASFDLSNKSPMVLISDALNALVTTENRIIRVTSPIEGANTSSLEMVIDEAPLVDAMFEYSSNIFWLSLVISLLTAILVYLSLHWLMVRPMGQLSASMIAFRRSPEKPDSGIQPSGRRDEIGVAEKELEIMQTRLRAALRQKDHLAALGTAVTKISHDLRNILSTSHLVSDSLTQIDDPYVQKIVPRLVKSIDQAIDLCTQTLKYGKAQERTPKKEDVQLYALVQEIKSSIVPTGADELDFQNKTENDIYIHADREQIYRVLLNLCRNAAEALEGKGRISVESTKQDCTTTIRVVDNGPGFPNVAREHLFEPFKGSAKRTGTGLGLSIAKELIVAHGGEIMLEKSDSNGTVFKLVLPD